VSTVISTSPARTAVMLTATSATARSDLNIIFDTVRRSEVRIGTGEGDGEGLQRGSANGRGDTLYPCTRICVWKRCPSFPPGATCERTAHLAPRSMTLTRDAACSIRPLTRGYDNASRTLHPLPPVQCHCARQWPCAALPADKEEAERSPCTLGPWRIRRQSAPQRCSGDFCALLHR
jgi:hypothetical protein